MSPFSLIKDESVFAEIISVNVYGSSVYSTAGNGAVIQLVPDAPLNLTNDPTTTSDTLIRFTWSQGLSNGGTPVIDYTVQYDQGTNNFITLASDVSTQYYVT